jgi:hypothetical protein
MDISTTQVKAILSRIAEDYPSGGEADEALFRAFMEIEGYEETLGKQIAEANHA